MYGCHQVYALEVPKLSMSYDNEQIRCTVFLDALFYPKVPLQAGAPSPIDSMLPAPLATRT